jgi:hypothetical protein
VRWPLILAQSRQQPRRYEILVRGHLGERMRSASPALHARASAEDAVLTGVLSDQAAMHGVLAEIEAPGLRPLEVRRLPPH